MGVSFLPPVYSKVPNKHKGFSAFTFLALYDVKKGLHDGHKLSLKYCSKQIWIRSFKWVTVHPCRSRGCKNIKGQSWRSIKNLLVQPAWAHQWRVGASRQFVHGLKLWPLVFLHSLDLHGCIVTHLKDLIHICLPEAQGCGMAFNMPYITSKYAYFIP